MSGLNCCTCCGDGTKTGIGMALIPISQAAGLLKFDVTGVTGTVSLTVPGGGRYYYDIWMSESQDDPREALFPARHDALHWKGITDAAGKAVFTFQYTGQTTELCPWGWLVRVSVGSLQAIGIEPQEDY